MGASILTVALWCATMGQVPQWALRSTWETAYESPGGSIVRARVAIDGESGTYQLYVPGRPVGRLRDIQFHPNFPHRLGGPADAIIGRWSFQGQTGYFVFRAPQGGVMDGYWGYFQGRQLGPIRGSWDGILILRTPPKDRAPIQIEPPPPPIANQNPVPLGVGGQVELKDLPRGMETIVDKDDALQANWLLKGAALTEAVGKLTLTKDVKVIVPDGFGGQNVSTGQAGQEVGTCFLVGRGIALSARHNFAFLDDPLAVEASFPTKEVNRFRYYSLDKPPILISPDIAVLQLKSADGAWPAVFVDLKAGLDGQGRLRSFKYKDAVVIHYPNNQPETLSFRGSEFTSATDETLRYTADTEKGSSGAPVFDLFWNLVAVHWGDPGDGLKNMGFRIDGILPRLREELPRHSGGGTILNTLRLQP